MSSFAEIISRIGSNDPTLTFVYLERNQIGDQEATELSQALLTNTTLTTLNLGDNLIGDQGATELSHALQTNTSLTTLYLYANQIGDQGATDLSHALEVNDNQLHKACSKQFFSLTSVAFSSRF